MDVKRIVLYFALALVSVMLWNAWQLQHHPANVAAQQQTQAASKKANGSDYTPGTFAPSNPQLHSRTAHVKDTGALKAGKTVAVKTDVLNATINLNGGYIVGVSLPKYPVSLKQKTDPVQILSAQPTQLYIAQSGLTKAGNGSIQYSANQSSYQLKPDQKQLVVTLTGKTASGMQVTKTFTFKPDHYVVSVDYNVKNTSGKPWKGSFYYQLTRKKPTKKGSFHSRSYNGAAISSPDKPYEKVSYKDMDEKNISRVIAGGWVAMQQQYFLSAWVPNQAKSHMFYSHVSIASSGVENNLYTIGFETPQVNLASGQALKNQTQIYIGPEIGKRLRPLAKGLDLTIDYGWLWPLSKFLFFLLSSIERFIGNWGWSIVILTLLIKLVFFTLSDKSYKSMAKMREVQPRLMALRERYKDDKQAMSKAMMEFYKKEKVNPMGGCLPMIIQIPVFIALYYMLIESVQLRQAPFIFWIHDLSVKDPYYILPVLMGLSMFLQQKLSPPPPDPTQAKIMLFLPVGMTAFFMTFPAGLVLYWLTNNVLSLAHQFYVFKTYDPKAVKKKRKK